MCSRPRPDTIGTLQPHALAIAIKGIEVLSPTPPLKTNLPIYKVNTLNAYQL